MNSLRRLEKKIKTKRVALALALTLAVGLALVYTAGLVWAGNPHFVETTVSCSDNTLSVDGKVAGLGDEPQICVAVSAEADCINGGGHHPSATNKESIGAEGTFPVQNGKAIFSLDLTATFSPSCSPPMFVKFVDIEVLVSDGTTANNCTDGTFSIFKKLGDCTP